MLNLKSIRSNKLTGFLKIRPLLGLTLGTKELKEP